MANEDPAATAISAVDGLDEQQAKTVLKRLLRTNKWQFPTSWRPDTQGFLAISIILIVAVLVLFLLVKPPTLNDQTSGVLMTIVGVLLACFKDVFGYFFGSSQGSKQKDDMMTKAVEKKDDALVAAATGQIQPNGAVVITQPTPPPATTTTITTEPTSPAVPAAPVAPGTQPRPGG